MYHEMKTMVRRQYQLSRYMILTGKLVHNEYNFRSPIRAEPWFNAGPSTVQHQTHNYEPK